MILNKKMLSEIINKEIQLLNEDCGCGCNGSIGGCGESFEDTAYQDNSFNVETSEVIADEEVSTEFLTKEEALKSVVAIAMSTSCPVTRSSLISAVRDLMH